jgi:hypothetical protein
MINIKWLIKVIIFFLVPMLQACSNVPAIWYVSVSSGDNSNNGHTQDQAFSSIQHALNLTNPGDTVIVYPGIYYENLVVKTPGINNAPITIQADKIKRGRVILSGAVKKIRQKKINWELVDQKLLIYRISLSYKPTRILADNIDLMPYPSIDDLKAFKFLKSNYSGPLHGYAWVESEQMLYVRIRSDLKYNISVNPNELTMAVSPPTGSGKFGNIRNRDNNYNLSILVKGESHIVIDGFTFETPGIGGVYTEGSDVIIRNSWFYGCRTGVAGIRSDKSVEKRANRVIVEYSYFTQFPTYSDSEDIIMGERGKLINKIKISEKILHWQRKGNFPQHDGVGRPYSYEVGLTMNMGKGWIIQNNHLYEAFEGISAAANHHSEDTLIVNNRFERINDNGIETENHAKNMTIANNYFIDVYEDISWQPIGGHPLPGPIYVFNNYIYQTANTIKMWEISKNWAGSFKLGTKDNYWEKIFPDTRNVSVNGGIWVVNNTIRKPHGRLLTYLNSTKWPLGNIHFLNNDIATWRTSTSDDLGDISFDYNLVGPTLKSAAGGYTANDRVAGKNGFEILNIIESKKRNNLFNETKDKHIKTPFRLTKIKAVSNEMKQKIKNLPQRNITIGPQSF